MFDKNWVINKQGIAFADKVRPMIRKLLEDNKNLNPYQIERIICEELCMQVALRIAKNHMEKNNHTDVKHKG